MKRFKVIKEYKNIYLCEDENGFKECFKKGYFYPDDEGFIYKKEIDHTCGEAKKRKPNKDHPFFKKFIEQ